MVDASADCAASSAGVSPATATSRWASISSRVRPMRTWAANLSISGVDTDTMGLPMARYSRSLIGFAWRTWGVRWYGMMAAANALPYAGSVGYGRGPR